MGCFIHDELDTKILILYVVSRLVEPTAFGTIYDLAYCDEGVNYFEAVECIHHLVHTQHLTVTDSGLYSITEKGVRNCKLCQDSISPVVRDNAAKAVERHNRAILRKSMVRAQVTQDENDDFIATMSLSGDFGSIMSLSLTCGSEEQAKLLTGSFELSAESIYKDIIDAILRPGRGAQK